MEIMNLLQKFIYNNKIKKSDNSWYNSLKIDKIKI